MGRITIFVKTPEGKSISLWVPMNSTIQFVKMLVEDKCPRLNLPTPSWQHTYLVFQGRVIYDDMATLDSLGVEKDHTIWMRIRVSNCKNCPHLKAMYDTIAKDASLKSKYKNAFREVAQEAADSVDRQTKVKSRKQAKNVDAEAEAEPKQHVDIKLVCKNSTNQHHVCNDWCKKNSMIPENQLM